MSGALVKGMVITAEEVKARWAYGEIPSARFGTTCKTNLPASVHDAAVNCGIRFSQVSASEWPGLIAALKIARPSRFVDNIDTFGAPNYVCVSGRSLICWVAGRSLASIKCSTSPSSLARLGKTQPVTLTTLTRASKTSHLIPFDLNFKLEEPLIAILVDHAPMLIEGYLRSILWLRNPVYPLRVWVPDVT